MGKSLVMTILGDDRPGLVDAVAQVIAEHGGNWVESRMAHLAGQFAGILRVEVADEQVAALSLALSGLQEEGLSVVVHADPQPPPPAQPLAQLELVGQDRPGIVREVAHVLAAHGVNVEDLSTECVTAPNTGQTLFRASAQLRLRAADGGAALRSELEQLAADMMVDITLGEPTERRARDEG